MNATTTYVSKKGMKELKRSIQDLERQLDIAMKELRDLNKGASREDRLVRSEKLSTIDMLEDLLREKRAQIASAKLFPRKRDAIKVALGSVVDLADQQGRLMRYTLVNSFEANPSDGRLSILSPLGQSLIGKTAHQTIEWTSEKLSSPRQLTLVRVV